MRLNIDNKRSELNIIAEIRMWRDATRLHISNIYDELHGLNESEKKIKELEDELIKCLH